MKSPLIETNIAFEFIYTMMGVAYYDKSKQADVDISNSRFKHFVSEFVENNYDQIPNIVINDIRLFLQDFSNLYVTLLHLTIEENITHPIELINSIKPLSTNDLLNLYLVSNETGLTTTSNRDYLDTTLEELTLKYHKDAKDKSLFYEFIAYPEGIINRFVYAMEVFYNDFFKPFEPTLNTKLVDLQQRHQELYDDNPEAFINAILFQSKESLHDAETKIHIYLGYFYGDRVSVAYGDDHNVYFFYGALAEKKLYSENLTAQYEELIKSLADDTRRKLIKYLMNAPHYNKEISDYLGITTATISYHIGRLVDLGIIHLKYQEGKRIYYQVDTERFNQLFDGLKRYLTSTPL